MKLLGNFQAAKAQIFEIFFEKCDPAIRTTCKSELEVKDWMKGKYLRFGYNNNIFNSEKFGENTFNKISQVDWIPIDVDNK